MREQLGLFSPKDGCSPQGQCGCCTVWIDGAARVSCVTPVARVGGREVVTIEGLEEAEHWAQRFLAHGASQCGFCTPGIIMRLAAMPTSQIADEGAVRKAMMAHLCRCTGWQPIVDAATTSDATPSGASPAATAERARIEGRAHQEISSLTVLGAGGFADDAAPHGARVGLRSATGEWKVAPTTYEARALIGKVQGRRTTTGVAWPVTLPEGHFDRTLVTTWTEPAYLEPDASWCVPGAAPASPLANGGAFGGKNATEVVQTAARLASLEDGPTRALYSREDVVRFGPKRPPLAIGCNADGSGVVRVGVSSEPLDLADVASRWPGLTFEPISVVGPPTSLALRGAVEMELSAVLATFQSGPEYEVMTPNGARARARIDGDGIQVWVSCGDPLDSVILRSYCTGAAHMAYSMVISEAIRVGDDGVPGDLTIRSFGICRAVDTPPIRVTIEESSGPAVNGSEAVMSAVAAAVWVSEGLGERWPTRRT